LKLGFGSRTWKNSYASVGRENKKPGNASHRRDFLLGSPIKRGRAIRLGKCGLSRILLQFKKGDCFGLPGEKGILRDEVLDTGRGRKSSKTEEAQSFLTNRGIFSRRNRSEYSGRIVSKGAADRGERTRKGGEGKVISKRTGAIRKEGGILVTHYLASHLEKGGPMFRGEKGATIKTKTGRKKGE